MAEVVNMPRLSDTMTEGVVAKWHKNVGDQVSEGDLLAEIETDKATMEFESFQEGFLLHIGVAEGAKAPVDTILAILGEKGEDITELLKVESAPEPKKEEPAKQAPKSVDTPKVEEVKVTAPIPTKTKGTAVESNGKAIASPLARKLADERNINLSLVKGTGDAGRIVKRDIDNYSGSNSAPSVERYTEVEVSQMRKVIAQRLGESKFTVKLYCG